LDRREFEERFLPIDLKTLSGSDETYQAAELYNESLGDIAAGNEDIAKIKIKKAINLDSSFLPANQLYIALVGPTPTPAVKLRPKASKPVKQTKPIKKDIVPPVKPAEKAVVVRPVKHIKPKKEMKKIHIDPGAFRKLFMIFVIVLVAAGVLIAAIFAIKGISSQIAAATKKPSATLSQSPSPSQEPTPTPAPPYEEYAEKLQQALSLSQAGNAIEAMRIVVTIDKYNFNTSDAAVLAGIKSVSQHQASYSSYFLGRPFVDAGDYASAIPYMDDAVLFGGLQADTEWVEYLDAYCYYMVSDWIPARDKFKTFLNDFPNSSYVSQVNIFLTEIGKHIQ
jgi:TolA-binding protein